MNSNNLEVEIGDLFEDEGCISIDAEFIVLNTKSSIDKLLGNLEYGEKNEESYTEFVKSILV